VAAGGVQHALRFAGRTGGVHDVQGVLGVERLGRVLGRLPVDDVVPPDVPSVGPAAVAEVLPGTAYDEHLADPRAPGQRLVDGRLQRRRLATAVAAVGGDHEVGAEVGDPVDERLGRE